LDNSEASKPVLILIEALMKKTMGKIHKRYSEEVVWENNISINALKKLNSGSVKLIDIV